MALLLAAGLGYTLWTNNNKPSPVLGSESYPSAPAVNNKNSSIRDKHRDPQRFGQDSMIRNNKFPVPSMNVKGLVTMNSKWPMNKEEWRLAYSAKAYDVYQGPTSRIDSLFRLKSPLFNGNDRRFNPAQVLRVPINPPVWSKPPPPPEPSSTVTTTD